MLSFLKRLFGGRPSPEQVYAGLRERLLVHPLPAPSDAIAVMEWNLGEAVATIVAVSDGTVSMYLSSGGGTIGAGEHPGPRAAGEKMIAAARAAADRLASATTLAPPGPGETAFHLRTASGLRSAIVAAEEFDAGPSGPHPLTSFFGAAQDVITALRTLG